MTEHEITASLRPCGDCRAFLFLGGDAAEKMEEMGISVTVWNDSEANSYITPHYKGCARQGKPPTHDVFGQPTEEPSDA